MTVGKAFEYSGSELDLFVNAVNWRDYWSSRVRPFLGHRVLEVGAGIGTITRLLHEPGREWVAVEPDSHLADRIRTWAHDPPQAGLSVLTGSIADVPAGETFDSILYFDVLEHIEDDVGEVATAFAKLAPGGRIIVLAPAHPWLFTSFDESIGHFRRYNRAMMRDIQPAGAAELTCEYLDSVGIVASTGNKLLLRSASPTKGQIQMWDALMVPMSRRIDGLLGHRLGKSLLTVWRRTAAGQ